MGSKEASVVEVKLNLKIMRLCVAQALCFLLFLGYPAAKIWYNFCLMTLEGGVNSQNLFHFLDLILFAWLNECILHS